MVREKGNCYQGEVRQKTIEDVKFSGNPTETKKKKNLVPPTGICANRGSSKRSGNTAIWGRKGKGDHSGHGEKEVTMRE